jgi:hypothetical protein
MRAPTAVTVSVMAMNACGGESNDTNTGGSGDHSATLQEACERVYDLYCQLDQRCEPEVNEVYYGSESACEASNPKDCRDILALAVNPTIERIDACRAVAEHADCEHFLYDRNPVECDFNRLHRADGETCLYNTDCESLNCPWTVDGSCAVCRPGLREGDSCQASTSDCGYSLTCDAGVCTPLSLLGEPCSAARLCWDGLKCVGGVCTRGSSPEGSPCEQDADCAPDLLCDTINTSGRCIRRQLRKVGEPCDRLGDYCEYGTACPLVSPYVCIQRIADGQSCDVLDILNCDTDALCLNGQCTVLSDLQCR